MTLKFRRNQDLLKIILTEKIKPESQLAL